MDPNATLRDINDFLAAGNEGESVDEYCKFLYDWLKGGGFAPDWNKYPLAADYYKCRKVYMDRGEPD